MTVGSGPSRSIRRQVGSLFAAVAVIAAVIFGVAAFSMNGLFREGDEVMRELDPFVVVVTDNYQALIDQESGVRGFALTGDERFLLPFEEGRALQEELAPAIRAMAPAIPGAARRFQAVERAAQRWHDEAAAPLVVEVRQRGTRRLSDERLHDARALFEPVRRLSAELDEFLAARREGALGHVTSARRLLALTIALAAVGVGLLVVAVYRALGRRVLEPIERLAADVEVVRGGRLRHSIAPSGPPEIQTLGEGVEAMRRRVIEELELVEEAQQALSEQTEDLARSNRDLEQFAYVASHDLQEPLRKVISFCQLLERRYGDQLDDRGHQYIELAVDGATRMQALVNDLLEFSRVGRRSEQLVPVDLDTQWRRVKRSFEDKITEAGAVIESDPLPMVMGDPSLLASLLQNLLGNSLKYRSEAPPRVKVSVAAHHDEWEFCFRDNGIGIEPEFAEQVFVIFQRLHGRQAYEGTGIGLALCKKIVEFHGGDIRVETDPALIDGAGPPGDGGPGTAIRFTLPQMRPSPSTDAPAEVISL